MRKKWASPTAPTSCDYGSDASFDANSAFRDYLTKGYVIPKLSKLNGTPVNRASGCLLTPGNAPDPSRIALKYTTCSTKGDNNMAQLKLTADILRAAVQPQSLERREAPQLEKRGS